MASQFDLTFTLGANSVTQSSPSYGDAAGQRFSDWIWAAYPQYDGEDENGNPIPAADTPANRAQSFRDFADAVFAGVKSNVLRHEKQVAAQAAQDNVGDITPA